MKTGIITGTLYDAQAAPLVGTITFTPYVRSAILDTSNDSVVIPEPVKVTLVGGAFSVTLIATDDPDLNPNGWTWGVRIKSADGTTGFSIAVPHTQTTNLNTVVPVAEDGGDHAAGYITVRATAPTNPTLNQLWVPL